LKDVPYLHAIILSYSSTAYHEPVL